MIASKPVVFIVMRYDGNASEVLDSAWSTEDLARQHVAALLSQGERAVHIVTMQPDSGVVG